MENQFLPGDPLWIIAKFPGRCARTRLPFKKGDMVFYVPATKQCFAGNAARAAEADFKNTAVHDGFVVESI